MLTLTEAAGIHLTKKLAKVHAADNVALRVVAKRHGSTRRRWGLRLDTARPADETIAHHGKMVLMLDEEVSEMLTDKTLGVKKGESGPKLTLLRG